MTPHDIAQARLLNQQIAGSVCRTPGEVVAALGALQAQDYSGALWAVGLRMAEGSEAAVEQAIQDRTIVRTWPLRGTLHFVAPADVRWLLDLLAPRQLAGSARRLRQLELDDGTLVHARDLIEDALQGGAVWTRQAILAHLNDALIATDGQRGYHILSHLALLGVLCFGPRHGKQDTFTLLDEFEPHAKSLGREEALAELARRYFRGHGPATLRDFVWWTGLTVADAKAGMAMVQAEFEHGMFDGEPYWMPPGLPELSALRPRAYLLPSFDEYLLGYRDRRAVLEPHHAGNVAPGGNGVFRPILVVDGRVVGTWKRTVKRQGVTVEATPFSGLDAAASHAFAVAADHYGRYLGLDVQTTVRG